MNWTPAIAPDDLGRPSKKGAHAALAGHLSVLKGAGTRKAISDALHEASGLGGQERRFVALAIRELSRHQRLLDMAAKLTGRPPSGFSLVQDQVLVRYVLWRRLFTAVSWERMAVEVGLPGPLRPRSIPDSVLEQVARAPLPSSPPAEGTKLEQLAVRYSLPRYLAEQLAGVVPADEVEALFASLNRDPPLVLRVRPPGTGAEVRAELETEGVPAQAVDEIPDALSVPGPGARVFDTRAFRGGRLQVQDLGSQLIVALCRPRSGWKQARILDLCAGAGGKTLALADLVGRDGVVVALDPAKRRLEEARRRARSFNLMNIEFPVRASLADAAVVLVDAPCSGSGVLGREPDLKWKISSASVSKQTEVQRELLGRALRECGPESAVVYATCSLLRGEAEGLIEQVLAELPDARVEPASEFVHPRFTSGPFLRLFPHRHLGGGFFAARLIRRRR